MTRRLAPGMCVLLLFAVVGVAMSSPLMLHLSDHLPGDVLGDNVAFLWNLWWMREAGRGFFFTHALFAPFGTDLVLHTHTALQAAIAATLLRPLNVVVAQNVLILATLTVNGFCAYLLALDRTSDRTASVLAGLTYACSPYVAAHLLGHFNLIGIWTLPLFTLCLLRTMRTPTTRWSAVTGLVIAAVVYTDYYYSIYCLLIGVGLIVHRAQLVTFVRSSQRRGGSQTVVLAVGVALAVVITSAHLTGGFDRTYLGVRVRANEPGNLWTAAEVVLLVYVWLKMGLRLQVPGREHFQRALRQASVLLPALGFAAILLMPVLFHAGSIMRHGDYSSPPHMWRSAAPGIDVVSLVLGNPFHAVTGAMTVRAYGRFNLGHVEGVGFVGIVASLAWLWAVYEQRKRPELRAVVLLGCFFLVWALGPWLQIAGHQTRMMMPGSLLSLVPVLSNARIPGRAIVGTLLAASLALAHFVAQLPANRRRPLVALLIVMLGLESVRAPFPLVSLQTPPIYAALPDGRGTVLELPTGLRDGLGETGQFDQRVMLYQAQQHAHPLVGGFIARVAPSIHDRYSRTPVLRSLFALSASAVDAHADPADERLTATDRRAALLAVPVAYVSLDLQRASDGLVAFVEGMELQPLASDGHRAIFAVVR